MKICLGTGRLDLFQNMFKFPRRHKPLIAWTGWAETAIEVADICNFNINAF